MTRPRLLDLFCGAGGAAMGYYRAGFDVVGIDIRSQPRYPFEFMQSDALVVLEQVASRSAFTRQFDAIHASPPCQFATAYRRRKGVALDAVNLIPETRDRLERTGLPYVIENVERAREHLRDPVMLCGSAFGDDLERHRLFETNWPLMGAPCAHGRNDPEWPQATNRANKRRTVEVGAWRIPLADQQRAMGIDWMTLPELSLAIPPAYTEHIGQQLMQYLKVTLCPSDAPDASQRLHACLERPRDVEDKIAGSGAAERFSLLADPPLTAQINRPRPARCAAVLAGIGDA